MGRITLPPVSSLVIEGKILKLTNTTNLYKMSAVTAQFSEGMILLDVLHRVDHKTLQYINIPILNTNNVSCNTGKNMPMASMHPAGMCKEVQEVSWDNLQYDTSKLLPQILHNTRLQLEPDSKCLSRSISDVDLPEEARMKLRNLLEKKYLNIISQNATDIGRTNLIALDILTEGLQSCPGLAQFH